jgi:hypothetical protein
MTQSELRARFARGLFPLAADAEVARWARSDTLPGNHQPHAMTLAAATRVATEMAEDEKKGGGRARWAVAPKDDGQRYTLFVVDKEAYLVSPEFAFTRLKKNDDDAFVFEELSRDERLSVGVVTICDAEMVDNEDDQLVLSMPDANMAPKEYRMLMVGRRRQLNLFDAAIIQGRDIRDQPYNVRKRAIDELVNVTIGVVAASMTVPFRSKPVFNLTQAHLTDLLSRIHRVLPAPPPPPFPGAVTATADGRGWRPPAHDLTTLALGYSSSSSVTAAARDEEKKGEDDADAVREYVYVDPRLGFRTQADGIMFTAMAPHYGTTAAYKVKLPGQELTDVAVFVDSKNRHSPPVPAPKPGVVPAASAYFTLVMKAAGRAVVAYQQCLGTTDAMANWGCAWVPGEGGREGSWTDGSTIECAFADDSQITPIRLRRAHAPNSVCAIVGALRSIITRQLIESADPASNSDYPSCVPGAALLRSIAIHPFPALRQR